MVMPHPRDENSKKLIESLLESSDAIHSEAMDSITENSRRQTEAIQRTKDEEGTTDENDNPTDSGRAR